MRPLLWCVAAAWLVAADAQAFFIKGAVLDGPGNPMPSVQVTATDETGNPLSATHVSGADGRFSLESRRPVARLVVVDPRSARCLGHDGPFVGDAELTVDLSQGRYFTLRGRIIDEQRTLLQPVMDPGARWSGEFDPIGRRLVTITAHAGATQLVAVHPETDGAFGLQSSIPITALTLDVSAGGTSLTRAGPWTGDATVDFVVSEAAGFTLTGHVRGAAGAPQAQQMVSAYDTEGRKLTFVYTDGTGRYALRTDRPVASLRTRADRQEIRRDGPWSADATVDLELDRATRFTLTGQARDDTGQALDGVRVVALDPDRRSITAVMTRPDGTYTLVTDRAVGELRGYRPNGQEATTRGPWKRTTSADLVFVSRDVFTLRGRVTDRRGDPVANAFIAAADTRGHSLKSTKTAADGRYEMEVVKEVGRLMALADAETTIEGPWSRTTTIDVTLDQ